MNDKRNYAIIEGFISALLALKGYGPKSPRGLKVKAIRSISSSRKAWPI
jgi:hypothetical protein